MASKKIRDRENSAIKDAEDWTTGEEPMTDAQDSYLHTLAREAEEPVEADLTKAEASKKTDELQEKTGRGTARPVRQAHKNMPKRSRA